MKTKKIFIGLGGLILGLGLIQMIPGHQSNPNITGDIPAPSPIKSILKRACYDCHSHETVWPWYSTMAPISWLVAWDVREGREELNFSTWNQYSAKKKQKKLNEIVEEMDENEMPPWFYLPLHPEARLSPEDIQRLREWATSSQVAYITDNELVGSH